MVIIDLKNKKLNIQYLKQVTVTSEQKEERLKFNLQNGIRKTIKGYI